MDPTGRSDLTALVARYSATARPCREPEPLGNAGGFSGARLWRYESARGRLVARAWPPDGPGRTALEEIHRWLGKTAVLGFVPVPIAALDGLTVHEQGGRLWEVSPWLEGTPVAHRPPSRPQLRSGLAALAAFHRALQWDRMRGPSPAVQARLRELESLLQGGFSAIEQALDHASCDPLAGSARRWLDLARMTAGQHVAPLRRAAQRVFLLQPCLRDARPEHLLFSGDRVTGLIDFGAMAVENVAADLARLLGDWVGPNPLARAPALAAYTEIRPLEALELDLIEVLEGSGALLAAGHWVRWHFLERRTFDDPAAVMRGIERGLERLTMQTIAAEGVT
jgi:homoserine kinase type II